MWKALRKGLTKGNFKALARAITMIENEVDGFDELLKNLPSFKAKITGITGPPGAGKSTITDALIGEIIKRKQSVGIVCIDPSSPFNFGALLGDRLRMSQWYNHTNVFIRSVATRGSLGGLSPKILEITDVMKAALFDHIIIETVGVGQSEVEIAGLADTSVVILVPESGDEVQTMKAGLMEIADIFVVNKCDRPGADTFVKNLQMRMAPAFKQKKLFLPIIKTVASEKQGIQELFNSILHHQQHVYNAERKIQLLTEKAFYLIQAKRMKNVNRQILQSEIKAAGDNFNLYSFVNSYIITESK